MTFHIDDFQGGSQSAKDKLNAMLREIESLSKIQGDSQFIAVTKSMAGVYIHLNVDAVIAYMSRNRGALDPVIITAVGSDTLTGRYLYPDGSGSLTQGSVDVTVLKPWTLRRTPFDGETVNGVEYTYSDNSTRTADNGEDAAETQYITQDYFIGAVIYVKPVNEPGYDVIDENVDSRAWATLES